MLIFSKKAWKSLKIILIVASMIEYKDFFVEIKRSQLHKILSKQSYHSTIACTKNSNRLILSLEWVKIHKDLDPIVNCFPDLSLT